MNVCCCVDCEGSLHGDCAGGALSYGDGSCGSWGIVCTVVGGEGEC